MQGLGYILTAIVVSVKAFGRLQLIFTRLNLVESSRTQSTVSFSTFPLVLTKFHELLLT